VGDSRSWDDVVRGECRTKCMLYFIVCCSWCMLYFVYAVLGVNSGSSHGEIERDNATSDS
jgi:hypothetical protein